MAEFSALVAIYYDPDSGQPSGLQGMTSGDSIASGVLHPAVREATEFTRDSSSDIQTLSSTVRDNSGGWNAGIDPGTYNDIIQVCATVNDGSGFWEQTYTDVRDTSTTWDGASSIANISATVYNNSGTWDAAGDPSAPGFQNWNNTYNNVSIASGTRENTANYVTAASGEIDVVRTRVITTSARDDQTDIDVRSVSGSVRSVSSTVTSTSSTLGTFSGDVQASVFTLDSSADSLNGTVTSQGTSITTNAGNISTNTGNISTNTDDITTLDVTVRSVSSTVTSTSSTLGTFSGDVQASVVTLDTSTEQLIFLMADNSATTWISAGDPSAPGFNDWNNTYDEVRDTSADIRSASGSVRSVSSTVTSTSSTLGDVSSNVATASGLRDVVADRVTTTSARDDQTYIDVRSVSAGAVATSSTLGSVSSTVTSTSSTLGTFSGDVQASVVTLDTSTEQLIFLMADNSATTWISAGDPSAPGFNDWNNTYDEVSDTSADVRSTIASVRSVSSTVTSTSSTLGSFSGDVQASVVTLDTSTEQLIFLMADNSATTWISAGDPSAPGFNDWNNTYDEVRDTSADVRSASGSVRSVSSTLSIFSGSVQASVVDIDTSARDISSITNTAIVNLSPVSARITTNQTNIGILDTRVATIIDNLSPVSGDISTNTTDIGTNTTDIATIIDNLSPVSGDISTNTTDIGTNTTNITTVINNLSPVSATISSNEDTASQVSGNLLAASGLRDVVITRVTSLSARDDQTDADVRSVSSTVTSTSSTLTSVSSNLGGTSSTLTAVSASVRSVSSTVTSTSSTLTAASSTLNTFSGNVQTSVVDIDTSARDISSITNTAIVNLSPVSATITTNQSNISTLDGRVATIINNLSPVSGDISTNTTNIGTNTTDIATLDGSATALNTHATNTGTIITNIGGVSGTSGTDFLGGATPTLSNDLNFNGRNGTAALSIAGKQSGANADVYLGFSAVRSPTPTDASLLLSAGAPGVRGLTLETNKANITLSSAQFGTTDGGRITLRAEDYIIVSSTKGLALYNSDGAAGTSIVKDPRNWYLSSISGYDYGVSAWSTVKDNSSTWTGGGGGTDIEPISLGGVLFCSATGATPYFGTGEAPTAAGQRLRWDGSKPTWNLIGGGVGTNGYILESDGAGGETWVPKSAFDDLAPVPVVNGVIIWTGSQYVSTNSPALDHGGLAGRLDDDHPQYVLVTTNTNLSAAVDVTEADIAVLGGVSGNIATNTGNISTNTGNISVLGGVSGNIATNTGNISTNTGNISTNTGNISTNTGNISVLGGVSGNIATNTGNISTNTGNISTNTGNISTNTGNITALGSASANWESTYNTVLSNSGTWGGGGGGASAAGFENWESTYQSVLATSANWDTAYLSATNTTDVSSIFADNINVVGYNAAHSGTVGTTNAATFGIESNGNTSIIAPSLIFSATSAYQFRKNGSTTFTDTDFPQSCRDWDSTYGTVLNNSGSWGGGGGGGVAAGITVVNTGTDNIDSAGALVPLDVTAGYPAYGSYATDYSYTAGNSYVTINTAGTYEVTFNVAYTSTVVRWNGILKIYKGTGGASPSSWIGYGASKMGYVRSSSGHNEASLILTCLVTCSANDTIGGWVEREAATGTCTTVANETFMTIKRMA